MLFDALKIAFNDQMFLVHDHVTCIYISIRVEPDVNHEQTYMHVHVNICTLWMCADLSYHEWVRKASSAMQVRRDDSQVLATYMTVPSLLRCCSIETVHALFKCRVYIYVTHNSCDSPWV